jgi:hypothetical protein
MTDNNSVACFHQCKQPLTVVDYHSEHLTGAWHVTFGVRQGRAGYVPSFFFLRAFYWVVRGVGVITVFSGCSIELDGFAGATLRTDNFIRVNKPSWETVEFMSAIRVRALEMKQLVEKT